MEYDARDASDHDPVEKSMKIDPEIRKIQQKRIRKITFFELHFYKKVQEFVGLELTLRRETWGPMRIDEAEAVGKKKDQKSNKKILT